MVSIFLMLQEASKLYSKVAVPFCITTSNEKYHCSTFLPAFDIFLLFKKKLWTILISVQWYLIVVSMKNDVTSKHLLKCLFAIIYLWWSVINFLPIFFFVCYCFMRIVYVFWILTLYQIYVLPIFISSLGLVFSFS